MYSLPKYQQQSTLHISICSSPHNWQSLFEKIWKNYIVLNISTFCVPSVWKLLSHTLVAGSYFWTGGKGWYYSYVEQKEMYLRKWDGMLFAIDFVEASGKMTIIRGTAGSSGLQAGFLKTSKYSTGAPSSPTSPLPNPWSGVSLPVSMEKMKVTT